MRRIELGVAAYLARYLVHIPLSRLQSVRGYGLYGQRNGAWKSACRLCTAPLQAEVTRPQRLVGHQ